MRYPANYGFVPHTLGEDGDPLDALVVARSPIVAGAVVKCRPVGVLMMEDDKGGDEKLLCVPVNTTFPYYADVVTYKDMPPIVLQQIEHFFTHYKDLEPGKWAKLNGWGDVDDAKRIIMECVERAKETWRMKAALLVPVVALTLAGCATPETRIRTALTDAGLSKPIAGCMADRMVDRLSLFQLNKLNGLKKLQGKKASQITIEEFVKRTKALQDPEILGVVSSSGVICAIKA
jgi:inorganic pyrophosphatase